MVRDVPPTQAAAAAESRAAHVAQQQVQQKAVQQVAQQDGAQLATWASQAGLPMGTAAERAAAFARFNEVAASRGMKQLSPGAIEAATAAGTAGKMTPELSAMLQSQPGVSQAAQDLTAYARNRGVRLTTENADDVVREYMQTMRQAGREVNPTTVGYAKEILAGGGAGALDQLVQAARANPLGAAGAVGAGAVGTGLLLG